MKEPVLLDVMVGGRFYKQLRYFKHGRPKMVDGKIIEVHDLDEIKAWVLERLPSIANKNYEIGFSQQKVIKQ